MIRKSLLLLALLLASWIVSAQSYLFKHLEVSDGLSNNSVNTIYKDRDGFMWFGTTTGDRKSTRLNSSHMPKSRMPSSA